MAAIKGQREDSQDGSVTITWTSVTTADSGDKVSIGDLEDINIHVVGSGTAQLQGSNDGTNFVNIGSALAANSLNQLTTLAKYLKFSTIASATVTIVLAAWKRR